MSEIKDKTYWMRRALAQAGAAAQLGEVPIGCVIVKDGEPVAEAHNLRESLQHVSAHAEMLALRAANENLASWRLDGCEVYVTLEPCPMCASALQQARVRKVYFAAEDPKAGAVCSCDRFFEREGLNHSVEWERGPLTEEASAMLKNFFKARRERNKKLNQRLGGRAARRSLMESEGPSIKAQALPAEGISSSLPDRPDKDAVDFTL